MFFNDSQRGVPTLTSLLLVASVGCSSADAPPSFALGGTRAGDAGGPWGPASPDHPVPDVSVNASDATRSKLGVSSWQIYGDGTSVTVFAIDGHGSSVFVERFLLNKVTARGAELGAYLQVLDTSDTPRVFAEAKDGTVLAHDLTPHDLDVEAALYTDLSAAFPNEVTALKGQAVGTRFVAYSCLLNEVDAVLSGLSLVGCFAPETVIGLLACAAGFVSAGITFSSTCESCSDTFPDRALTCNQVDVPDDASPSGVVTVNQCQCACK